MASEPAPRGPNRSPATGRIDGFAVARALRGSRPMAVLLT